MSTGVPPMELVVECCGMYVWIGEMVWMLGYSYGSGLRQLSLRAGDGWRVETAHCGALCCSSRTFLWFCSWGWQYSEAGYHPLKVHKLVPFDGDGDSVLDKADPAARASSSEEGGVNVGDRNGASTSVVGALYGGLPWDFLRH